MLATAITGKNRERFWKNAGEWTGRVELSKEEIPGSKMITSGLLDTLYTPWVNLEPANQPLRILTVLYRLTDKANSASSTI